jgi:predicted nucleotidyltransferase
VRPLLVIGPELTMSLLIARSCGKDAYMKDLKQKVHKIAPTVFEGTPVVFAYLYGSYAKGRPHPFSDLDIGVFVEGLDMKACLALELSLALRFDGVLDHKVQSEVRVLNHLPLVVKGTILGEAEVIYSRNEGQRIDFEAQVRRAYFDFLPVIQHYQKAVKERALSE